METNEKNFEEEIASFRASCCPYGYLDIKAAIREISEAEPDNAFPDVTLSEYVEEYCGSVGIEDRSKLDVTAIAYEYVLGRAREEMYSLFDAIDTECPRDLCDFIWVEGNYMATSYAGNPESLKEYLDGNGLGDALEGSQYLSHVVNSF